jgi:hypothetical protein
VPTTITTQNGDLIERNTRITIQECAAVEAAKSRDLINAQKLAKALAICRSEYKHAKTKRVCCEKVARRRYPLGKRVTKRTRGIARAHGR